MAQGRTFAVPWGLTFPELHYGPASRRIMRKGLQEEGPDSAVLQRLTFPAPEKRRPDGFAVGPDTGYSPLL
jgi:hypothetical protein